MRARLGRVGLVAIVSACTLVAGIWIGARSGAASTPQPGSAADPLVSRSYVTKALNRVLAEAGGRLRTLAAGETFTLGGGTAFVLLAGGATVVPGSASAASAAGAPVTAPLVDLTGGRGLVPAAGASSAAVPLAHLLLSGAAGTRVTAGRAGAILWLLGAEAAATGAAPSAG